MSDTKYWRSRYVIEVITRGPNPPELQQSDGGGPGIAVQGRFGSAVWQ